jgi:DNA polymerase elongation subunit (family B)
MTRENVAVADPEGRGLGCSERALLNHLMIKLHQVDPDVLVGHNISGFDLDVLLHRLQVRTRSLIMEVMHSLCV